MHLLSIVIPTYNSIAKMGETIASLHEATEHPQVDVIIVDDCSTDDTYGQLLALAEGRPSWTVTRLEQNSGSAAGPRNKGLEIATGRYVFFLDSDDALIVPDFHEALVTLEQTQPDLLRTPLRRHESNGSELTLDKVPDFGPALSLTQRIRKIVAHQSLTVSCFFRRELLMSEQIRFDPARRIGEDITFTAQALAAAESIEYVDVPVRTYRINGEGNDSVTQSINSSQFADFVKSWEDVESTLEPTQVSFLKEHGFAAVQYALRQYIWFRSEPISREAFEQVSAFFKKHWDIISEFPLPQRLMQVAEAAKSGSQESFNREARLRLLVAGHDLKFMTDLMPRLEANYAVRQDVWASHTGHNEQESAELLEWADLIWAEWLLGAAVWYSKRLSPRHRMVVRAHRSEMTVPYGDDLAIEKVGAVLAISPHCLRDFADRFDLPATKMRLVPNAFAIDAYTVGTDPDRIFRLALVGALPKLKGLRRALELLTELRRSDQRFSLTIYGKEPQHLPWLWNQPSEREYYESCYAFIAEQGLTQHVTWGGWVDTRAELANHGVVLSMSDLEGMQVAPAEAFCAGGIGLFLPWRGVEDLYPHSFICSDIRQMATRILDLREPGALDVASQEGREFLSAAYGEDVVWEELAQILAAVRA